MTTQRETAAMVTHSNGAWLIQWTGSVSEDLPDGDRFDCASSLVKAKRIAREGALSMGYFGAARWTRESFGWTLDLSYDDDYEYSEG